MSTYRWVQLHYGTSIVMNLWAFLLCFGSPLSRTCCDAYQDTEWIPLIFMRTLRLSYKLGQGNQGEVFSAIPDQGLQVPGNVQDHVCIDTLGTLWRAQQKLSQ